MKKERKPQRRDMELFRLLIQRVRTLRESQGYSQGQVNADTDIDVAHLESGTNYPSFTTISILCDFYGITLREFFDNDAFDYPPKKKK